MRRMVARRIDLDDVGQRRRARLGSRSDSSLGKGGCNLAPAGFVSPVSCCRKQPSGASHTTYDRLRGVSVLFVGLRGPGFRIHSAAHRTRAHGSVGQPGCQHPSVSRPPTWNLSEAHPAGREPHQYQPSLLPR